MRSGDDPNVRKSARAMEELSAKRKQAG